MCEPWTRSWIKQINKMTVNLFCSSIQTVKLLLLENKSDVQSKIQFGHI